jgi:hypothetical protein
MKYETLEEALKDVEAARSKPTDRVLLYAIRDKVKNSSIEIQKLFQDHLEDYLFENQPKRFMKLLKERYKGYAIFHRKKIFFEA